MKIIVSGGGTGGHIYPALTLIRTIQKKMKDVEVLYVGTKRGLEADIIPKEGLPFATVDIRGFERRLSLRNLKTLCKAFYGVHQAHRIVQNFKPDIVIGTGGYVCGPVLLAASLQHIPTLIQEQNVIPGITNKILSRFVSKIAVGCEGAMGHFPADKAVFTGNPIRPEVLSASRAEGFSRFGLDPGKKTVLISGGSRGARSINTAFVDVHRRFAGSQDVQFLHVTGKGEYESVLEKVKEAGIDLTRTENILIEPYLYDMPQAMAIADLVVFRAGATGLAEITAKGIPAILVPYPYAAENHQEYNARAMEKAGAAVMVKNKDISGTRLIAILDELLGDEKKLVSMANCSREIGKPKAAEDIAEIILSLCRQGRKVIRK